MPDKPIADLLERALSARDALFDAQHQTAFRLFNGFTEGHSLLVIDLYASTIVLHNYAYSPSEGEAAVHAALQLLRTRLPWVHTIVLKTRNGSTESEKRGTVVHGSTPDRRVLEHGIWYTIDLLMNRDASFYLDTRQLRQWIAGHLKEKTVLNTFACTGSLGVAAQAGGAARVVHLDRNRAFLNLAKTSYSLNGFPVRRRDFQTGDFWAHASRLKRSGEWFDCVLLDPPFFAAGMKGTVDMVNNSVRLINKVRPLINDGGYLVAVNNALFLSGKDYISILESLCADGYLQIEELITVPEDFTGYSQTRLRSLPVDPAPFNHATKIAVLRVRRKAQPADGRPIEGDTP
ncbi:MAG: class I SAM-dependent methyltransferase [Chloroflexi bacterium]|nr:class I SAM-dependent methyltransferase [Chloroflexota bacterium]